MLPLNLTQEEHDAVKGVQIDNQLFGDFLALRAELAVKMDTVKAENERSRLIPNGGRKPIRNICMGSIWFTTLVGIYANMPAGPGKNFFGALIGIAVATVDFPIPIRLRPCERVRNHVPKLIKGTGGNLISITDAKPNTDVIASLIADSDGTTVIDTKTITIDADGIGEDVLVIPAGSGEAKANLKIEQEVLAANDPDNGPGVAIVHLDEDTLKIV